MEENNKILIYTDNDGLTKIDVKLEEDTLWLTQAQMCELYQTSILSTFSKKANYKRTQLFGNSEQLPQMVSHT